MNLSIYEALKKNFIEIRYLYSKGCFDELRFETSKHYIESLRDKLEKQNSENHQILIYCIDNLFEIISENNRQKSFDFADVIHNMPEICMQKRTFKSFKKEISIFNKKYRCRYFVKYFNIFNKICDVFFSH